MCQSANPRRLESVPISFAMATESAEVDCDAQPHRKMNEDELKEFIEEYNPPEDAALLWEFLSSQPNERRLQNETLPLHERKLAYTRLLEFLRLFNTHTMLEILETRSSVALGLVHELRGLSFTGSWLDYVEDIITRNDLQSLQKLEETRDRLDIRLAIVRSKIKLTEKQAQRLADEHDNIAARKNTLLQARAKYDVKYVFE